MSETESTVLLWVGFLGAWFLVAGPLFQASIELSEFDQQHRSLAPDPIQAAALPRVSAWWWLLPPVGYVLQSRRGRHRRNAVMRAASQDAVRTYVRYTDLARGWGIIACGAFFFAIKETGDLADQSHWPTWVLCSVVATLLALSAVPAAIRARTTHQRRLRFNCRRSASACWSGC